MCSIVASPANDPPPTPLEALETEICELAAHINAAMCRWLLLIAEFDERGGWGDGGGTKSCAHWLSWRCSLAPRTAREYVRVARRLVALPLVSARFASGELSYCKVRAISRVATPETEEYLVGLALHATGAQLEKLVRGYGGALSATLEQTARTIDTRYFSCAWEEDGSLRVSGRLPAADGALLLAAIDAAEREATKGGATEDPRTTFEADPAGARRADALVAVARTALSADDTLAGKSDPTEVIVHVDVETLTRDQVKVISELGDGPGIAPETARRLACDSALVRIVEQDGRPLSVGRRTRTVPPALRRALRSRDRGCRFPGCDHRRHLHAHHIQHWARGGPTSIDNLVTLCSFHHRLVHEGGYRVERDGQGTIFRRPNGRVIPNAGPCQPARGPGLVQQNAAKGRRIDASTCRPRSPGEPLDYGLAVEHLLRRLFGPG
jgi:hypothetical protein